MATVTPRRTSLTERLRSERGVSLIHIGIAIFVIMGFSAFVLDHGVMMVARGQAQNVADAAAISAITTRVRDEANLAANLAAYPMSDNVLYKMVDSQGIFGGTPTDTGRSREWSCPNLVTGWCVQVYVFRDGAPANGSTTLPVYFAPLFGLSSQKVQAYAAAVAKDANGTRCLKPFLIPDKWEENGGNSSFNPANGDVYRPWTVANPTGYSTADFNVTTVVLKPGTPANTISPSDFFEINEFGQTGGKTYETSIINCEIAKKIGDTVELFPGNTVGPTNQGIDGLLAANGGGPVDVIIGMFDPAVFEAQRRQSGRFILQIVNLVTVRISGRTGSHIDGLIVGGVGENMGPGPTPTGVSSLIKVVQLVR